MTKSNHWRTILLLALLVALHLPVIFAGFFAPYDYALQDRNLPLRRQLTSISLTRPEPSTSGHLFMHGGNLRLATCMRRTRTGFMKCGFL